LVVAAAAVLVMSGVAAAWVYLSRNPQPQHATLPSAAPRAGALPVMWPAPQFAFPDQDDTTVTTSSLRGKVCIVDFIFTQCGNTCPRMTAEREKLIKAIADPRVMFLSISVDPQHDDRKTRKSYAAEKRMDESRWKFVCPPDRAAALKIAQQMHVAALTAAKPGDEPILHSDRFVLLDPAGKIRGLYPLNDEGALARLVSDATTLARDAAR
jgi:protein SCO1/2